MRVLLVRAGALGDVLLLRRAVAGLRSHGASVTLLAPRSSGAVLVGPGGSEVQRLLAWDRPEIGGLLGDGLPPGEARDQLAAHDLAIVYSRSEALAHGLERLIPRVVVRDPIPPAGVHASRWYAGALEELGLGVPGDPPVLEPGAEDREQARSILEALGRSGGAGGYLALHPGSGSAAKSWPVGRFAALADALSGGRPWLLVEGPADAAPAASLAGHPGATLARDLSARAVGALLARARIYVGNDSGVSHLAAACGAPTVALFGPTDPQVWSPAGPGVAVVVSPDRSMSGITLGAVLDAVGTLENGGGPARGLR